jgi:Ca2+:H+ antiporter
VYGGRCSSLPAPRRQRWWWQRCWCTRCNPRDRVEVAFSICLESSKQIALLVAPLLVLVSGFLGHPLTLEFSHLEVLALAISVGATTIICLDGESNWLEGAMLLGVYALLAIVFFFVP